MLYGYYRTTSCHVMLYYGYLLFQNVYISYEYESIVDIDVLLFIMIDSIS